MRRVLTGAALGVALAAAAAAAGTANAAASTPDVVISGGPYSATRAADGTATLSMTISNLTSAELTATLETADGSCTPATAQPVVPAATSTSVTFTMQCSEGSAPRSAALRLSGEAVQPPDVPLTYSVTASVSSDWSRLWAFAWAGYLALFLGVLAPFLLWCTHPLGNPGRPPSGPEPDAGPTPAQVAALVDQEQVLSRDLGAAGPEVLLWPLPGITEGWTFNDNWVSNIGLAGSLVTALFASTDTINQVLGSGTAGGGAVVAVAGALSAALISSGPLWLTIWKRRYVLEDGLARHNTIGGVLCASLVVLTGAIGLVLVGASVLDRPPVWIGAAVVVGFLLLYASKSIPQTLALGLHTDTTVSGLI